MASSIEANGPRFAGALGDAEFGSVAIVLVVALRRLLDPVLASLERERRRPRAVQSSDGSGTGHVLPYHVAFEVHADRRRAACDRLVCCHRERHDHARRTGRRRRSATVRLMPSTATDPLRTSNGASVRRKADGQPVELAVRRASPRRCPIASTWPWTKWPPNRLSARSGRSRFTGCPAAADRASSRAAFRARRRRESRRPRRWSPSDTRR